MPPAAAMCETLTFTEYQKLQWGVTVGGTPGADDKGETALYYGGIR